MSLAERLITPPVKGTQTVLDRWLDTLDAKDLEAVQSAILDPAWRHVDLIAVLVEEGAPKVADTTFGVWRRGKGWKQ